MEDLMNLGLINLNFLSYKRLITDVNSNIESFVQHISEGKRSRLKRCSLKIGSLFDRAEKKTHMCQITNHCHGLLLKSMLAVDSNT